MLRLKYNPALDGIRALAVLAVFCHHTNAMVGGYLGVDIFFVVSGFLITGLLLEEWSASGDISIKAFYVRRAYRLLPAFYLYVLVGAVLVLLFKGAAQQHEFFRSALASLLYVVNYDRAFFHPAGGGSWFGHVWSLSAEEQFYFIWPLCFVWLCRKPRLRQQLPAILLAAALLVFIWREIVIAMGGSDLRIYFALDTRADALLIGCALGAIRYNGYHFSDRGTDSAPQMPAVLPRWISIAGPFAFAALALIMLSAPALNQGITWLDRSGYTLVAMLSGVLVLSVDPSRPSWWSGVLGSRPLAALGRISYGFYLWHFPVSAIVPRLVPRIGEPLALSVALLASVTLAYLSALLIEHPAQRRRPAWAIGQSRSHEPSSQLDQPATRPRAA
jgi:peptidoglycan/LPS O-acetylase OafA/YrhL